MLREAERLKQEEATAAIARRQRAKVLKMPTHGRLRALTQSMQLFDSPQHDG